MLDLHRLRLLRELHERGTIAAVAEALRFTPSAGAHQPAVLERETGLALLVKAGRGVRLTDPALVLVGHADALLERVAVAEAELAAASGAVAGRARGASCQSVALRIALPAMRRLATDAPGLRCELVEAEPEWSLPALALGDVDLVLADEWEHQPLACPSGVARQDLVVAPMLVILPEAHPAARGRGPIALADLAGDTWVTGQRGMAWEEITRRTCRMHGGLEPDIRHRANDAVVSLALVAAGRAVTLLPGLVQPGAHPGVRARPFPEGSVDRPVFAATREADAQRPSVRALLAAVRDAAADLDSRH